MVYDTDTERVVQVTDANKGVWKVSAPSYSTGSSSYSDTVHASGPSEYWRLGDRRGTTAVSGLPEGSEGRYGDGVALGTYGAFADGDDTAAGFNGDSYIELADNSLNGTTLSAELWFRTSKSGVLLTEANADISEDETPTHSTPLLYVGTDGKLHGQFYSDATSWTPPVSKNAVNDSQWHHAVLVGKANASSLYIDGVLAGSVAGTITHLDQTRVFLGKSCCGTRWAALDTTDKWGYFSGAIDEVAFYPKALTASEIRVHYRARTAMVTGDGPHYRGTVTADAPAGYWRLDESSGSTARSKVAAQNGDGSYTNASLGVDGVFGTGDNTAITLNGNGYTEIPEGIMHGSTDLAVELWFKTTKPGVLIGDQTVPVSGTPDPATNAWAPVLYVGSDGKLHGKFFVTGLSSSRVASTDNVDDGQWHHAVVTATGIAQILYLDGIQAATFTGAVNHQSSTRTYIGAGFAKYWPASPADVSYFTGQIDEVAVYQHGLTPDQVAEHYRSRERSSTSALAVNVSITDPKGTITSTVYDALRGQRRIASSDAAGGLTTYAYDTGGYLHTVTDPNGHATITGHDAQGNTVSRTTCRDANSCWTSYSEYYNNASDPLDPRNGLQTVTRDARSSGPADNRYKTTTGYTTMGLPDKLTLADGRTSSTSYTTGAEPASSGGTTPAGLVASAVTPGGAITTYSYFATGDLAKVTAPNGLVTSFTYDGIGRKVSETQTSVASPEGVTTTYGYDSQSRVITETGAGVKNEVTGVTHTAKTTLAYDPDGNLLSETSEDLTGGDSARTETYHYDELGLNDSTTDAEGNTTTYSYDALGQLTSEKDPLGTEFARVYTPRGDVAETILKDWTGHPSGDPRDLVVESNAYDPAGRLASTTDSLGATTSFSYFDDGLLATTTTLQVEQPDGSHRDVVQQSNTYDGANYLIKQVTGGGAVTETFTVDATGRITRSVFDPDGLNRSADYLYDKDDRLTDTTRRVSTTESRSEHASYDQAGNITAAVFSSGATTVTTRNTYDQRGLLLTSITPRGTKAGADPDAYTTNYRYDSFGRLVEQASPTVSTESGTTIRQEKPTVTYGYNNFGELSHLRDEDGAVTRSELDRLGRTTTLTLPAYTPPGGTTITPVHRTAYDATGRVSSTTDPLDRTTRYTYDQLNHLTQRTDPLVSGTAPLTTPQPNSLAEVNTSLSGEGITRYTWTPTGLPLSVTTPTGARAEATYDELGRQLTSTEVERYPSLQNLTTRYAWDDADNQTAVTSPAGRVSTSTYNPAGEPLTVTLSGEGTTRYTYDSLGRATSVTDGTKRKTTFAYDLLDNITTAADYGTGATILRAYTSGFDEEGNQISATTPTGGVRTFTYDALGQLTRQEEKVSDTKSITSSFGYDVRGNLTRFTDGRGNSTHYTFNSWGLPETTVEPPTTKHPGMADRTWTTVYNAAGEPITELLPGNVKRQRTYDSLGRLIREVGSGTTAVTTPRTFSYDLDSRLTSSGTSLMGPANTYTYNDRGMLLSSEGPSGNSQYSYDPDGNMNSRTDAAGTTTYTFDSAGRLDTAADPLTGTRVLYDYDDAGRPTLEQYARPAASGQNTITSQRAYGYDSLGRQTTDTVTRVATGSLVANTAYGYDLNDRLVQKNTTGTAGAGDNRYAYDLADRMTSWTGGTKTTPYSWDDSGNLVKQGVTDGMYNSRNQLESWGTQTLAYSPRGTTESITQSGAATRSLAFDAFERATHNGSSSFTYDSLDRVLTDDGTTFTYDGVTNHLVTDATTAYTRTPDGDLLASAGLATAGLERLAVTDQHTDLIAGLSADGTTIAGSRAYDPFGKVTASDGATPALGYQSGWTDPATGEVNMAARWYQPGTGSFTSRDTWQLDPTPSGQANRYGYGEGGPLNGTDPTGHAFDGRCGCGGMPGSGARGGYGGATNGGGSIGRPRPPARNSSTKKTKTKGKSGRSGTGRPSGSARTQECSKYSSLCRGTTTGRSKPKPKGCAVTGTCRTTNRPTINRGNTGNRGSGTTRGNAGSRSGGSPAGKPIAEPRDPLEGIILTIGTKSHPGRPSRETLTPERIQNPLQLKPNQSRKSTPPRSGSSLCATRNISARQSTNSPRHQMFHLPPSIFLTQQPLRPISLRPALIPEGGKMETGALPDRATDVIQDQESMDRTRSTSLASCTPESVWPRARSQPSRRLITPLPPGRV
ncbi:hypothetical protein SLA_5284 [Streptomyces laurentii]|uniref:Laminin G domain-containing protein n=1 Tax=Streptomyces laurentii TaxID=39478 RepID=A0A160P5E1_STRLU|nr:hypothetical protein SLA_5284 [Streptomyces laurentii]